jgi:predicted RNA methylase
MNTNAPSQLRQLAQGPMWGLWAVVALFVALGIGSKFTDLGAGNGNLLLGAAALITAVAVGVALVKDRAARRRAS